MEERCLFCKIVAKEIPAAIVYEDDCLLAFQDIRPKAKVHILVVPKQHICNLMTLEPQDQALMGRMLTSLTKIAKAEGLQHGFRTVINTGTGGGQEIDHLHFHILGGGSLPGF